MTSVHHLPCMDIFKAVHMFVTTQYFMYCPTVQPAAQPVKLFYIFIELKTLIVEKLNHILKLNAL